MNGFQLGKFQRTRSRPAIEAAVCYAASLLLVSGLVAWFADGSVLATLGYGLLFMDLRSICDLATASAVGIGGDIAFETFAPDFLLDSLIKLNVAHLFPYGNHGAVFVLIEVLCFLAFAPAALTLLREATADQSNISTPSSQPVGGSETALEQRSSDDVRRMKAAIVACLFALVALPAYVSGHILAGHAPILGCILGGTEKILILSGLSYALSIVYSRFNGGETTSLDMPDTLHAGEIVEDEEEEEYDEHGSKDDRASDTTDSGIIAIRPLPENPLESAWVGGKREIICKGTQTPGSSDLAHYGGEEEEEEPNDDREPRSLDELLELNRQVGGAMEMTDEELVIMLQEKQIRSHALEAALGDDYHAVRVRRRYIERLSQRSIKGLPHAHFDYSAVKGANCESVIGHITVPVGVAGPLNLNGEMFFVPMSTTEGCLVASVNRGCAALRHCGVTTAVEDVGMTRAAVVRFPDVRAMDKAKTWLREPHNFQQVKAAFDGTSRFARLQEIFPKANGLSLHLRFRGTTGDAMGMNMITKATEAALRHLSTVEAFREMEVISLSGNMCTDKKAAAINSILGRGKEVNAEATVPREVVEKLLKTTTANLVRANKEKNLKGSAMAGAVGGFNSQASNVVTAVFLATGQDAAQNVVSSNCFTDFEETACGDLRVTCSMPSIEVGTVGGGTILEPQASCLNLLGVKGSNSGCPGDNAKRLASVVCGAVLAGELSLMSALTAGHLVRSHMKHNRSSVLIARS